MTFDQLSLTHGAIAGSDPAQDQILFIESESMLAARNWHHQRLFFLLSAAAHVQAALRERGFAVHVIHATNFTEGIKQFRESHPNTRIVSTTPSSRGLKSRLVDLEVELVPNDNFLTSPEQFATWVTGYKSLTMEYFYRWQRKRLDILMDGNEPVGGQWNFDHDNRLPPPKTKKGQPAHRWPRPLTFTPDDIDHQILDRISTPGPGLWGDAPVHNDDAELTWATTRDGALQQLEYFLENSLADFGPYEDAMPTDTWTVNHSLLSPYLNVGLLHPQEVVDAAVMKYASGGIPLSSIEGLVRQIIGWREYINGIYWYFPDHYREENQLRAGRELLPLFRNPRATSMTCMSSVIGDVHARAWTHHIPRLMLLSNLALLAGVAPQHLLNWMRESFIDAADWVMVPNVIGMGMHADGGRMMTKPYIAGGAYISRMSNYCGSCIFNPKKRTGEDACPFTTLYWDFLDRHASDFAGNHRMSRQVSASQNLTDLEGVRERASEVISRLEQGTL